MSHYPSWDVPAPRVPAREVDYSLLHTANAFVETELPPPPDFEEGEEEEKKIEIIPDEPKSNEQFIIHKVFFFSQ